MMDLKSYKIIEPLAKIIYEHIQGVTEEIGPPHAL
jgi:hypothetical protein